MVLLEADEKLSNPLLNTFWGFDVQLCWDKAIILAYSYVRVSLLFLCKYCSNFFYSFQWKAEIPLEIWIKARFYLKHRLYSMRHH